MENYLLKLWNHVPSGFVKQSEIADLLEISQKQLTRYFHKWMKEGWLHYEAGKGRGKLSTLTWLQDVEAVYEDQFLSQKQHESIEKIAKYLLMDWSMDCKLRLMNVFKEQLGYDQSTDDKLIIPRKYPFLTVHPLYAADVHSANLVTSVYNRLVTVDENGQVEPELAHSWDLTDTTLLLYLKKDVKFHDGSILQATDVVKCLEKLKEQEQFRDLWRPITSIKAVGPLIVQLKFEAGCSYCLQLLGTMNASIYKENTKGIIGTGGFMITQNDELKTVLQAFLDYYQERPLLDVIEFIQVPKDFDMLYRSSMKEKGSKTFKVESDSGFGLIGMNITRKTDIQRQEVRDYIHYVIAQKREEVATIEQKILPNHAGFLIGHSQPYKVKEVPRPNFTSPLIIKVVSYSEKISLWLQDLLLQAGVPVELKHVKFIDTIQNNEESKSVDLIVHGEVFEMNQNISFYQFLLNGFSSIAPIAQASPAVQTLLKDYPITPFEEWTELNLRVEKELIQSSLLVPLYYSKRHIPFTSDLENIQLRHFGFVDFTKLWVKPKVED